MDKAPKIYADWIKVFNVLKSGEDDEAILPLMQEGEIVWQSGVAERFLRKLVDTVNFRLNKAIDSFQKSRQSDENEIVQSLMQLRRELQFMLKVVDINAVPVKEKITKKVEKNEYEGFANGFPAWNLEPPQVAVRRKK